MAGRRHKSLCAVVLRAGRARPEVRRRKGAARRRALWGGRMAGVGQRESNRPRSARACTKRNHARLTFEHSSVECSNVQMFRRAAPRAGGTPSMGARRVAVASSAVSSSARQHVVPPRATPVEPGSGHRTGHGWGSCSGAREAVRDSSLLESGFVRADKLCSCGQRTHRGDGAGRAAAPRPAP